VKLNLKFERRLVNMLSRKRLAMVAFIAFALLPPVSPMARTITVDDDGLADYSTIEAAVNAATGGDTVFVKAGTYYECGIVLVQGFTSNKECGMMSSEKKTYPPLESKSCFLKKGF